MDNTSEVKPIFTPEIWDFFPLIMCINLRERTDRFEEAKHEFARVGIRQVVFFQSERQADRDKAIIDAHMACLRYAVERNVPYFLVFEDDALFLEGYKTHLPQAIEFLRSRSDWNLFHFGGFIFRKVGACDAPHSARCATQRSRRGGPYRIRKKDPRKAALLLRDVRRSFLFCLERKFFIRLCGPAHLYPASFCI